MEHFFQVGPLPDGTPWAFEPAFFNTHEYLRYCEGMRVTSYYVIEQRTKAVCGVCHFHIGEGFAASPYRAPFGSVDYADGLNPRVLYDFLVFMEDSLRGRGVAEIRLINPPSMDQKGKVALLETFLFNRGFQVINAEVTTVLRVAEVPFEETVRSQERTLVRRALSAGLEGRRPGADEIDDVYGSLAAWYGAKNYDISVEGDYLLGMVRRFPDRYRLFTVIDDTGRAVAASVTVCLNRLVMYNFLFNHDPAYDAISPSRLLMRNMYSFCREEGIRYFDLGTSALNRQPNFPLLDFKRHMGGIPVSKLTFQKMLVE